MLNDGRILMYGGTLPTIANNGLILGQPHPLLEVYDPASEDWSLILPFDIRLVGLNVVPLADGSVLLFALRKPDYEEGILWPARLESDGDNSPLPLYTVFRLDEDQGTYVEISTATVPRASPSIVPLSDGHVMLLGGSLLVWDDDPFTGPPLVTDVEIYDPVRDSWKTAAPLPSEFIKSQAEAGEDTGIVWVENYGDKVAVIVAGETEDHDARGLLFIYDPAEDSWETLTEFGFESIRSAPRVTAISNGSFIFFYNDDYKGDRVEVFDPHRNEWSFATYSFWTDDFDPDSNDEWLNEDRREGIPDSASIVALPDGRLLIAGGDRSSESGLPGVTTSVYDPSTGAWVDGPVLGEPRSRHSAIMLPNGDILLFGGVTIWEENESEGVPTNSMEIIPASSIAAVDTSITPAAGRLSGSPWQTCLGETGLEVPTDSTPSTSESTLSASDIMARSSAAMDALHSYSIESAFNSSQVKQFVHLTYALNEYCRYSDSVYQRPNRYLSRSFTWWQGQSILSSEHIIIGEIAYARWYGEELWTERETRQPLDEIAPHTDFFNVEAEGIVEDFRIVGTISLNDVDVYVIRGSIVMYDDISDITLWIGIDDLLLHRAYEADRLPEELGRADTSDNFLVFRSFNEDFDIQPPPASEIAPPDEDDG